MPTSAHSAVDICSYILQTIQTVRGAGLEPRCIILGQNPSRELGENLLNNWRPLPPDTVLFGLPVVTVFHDVEAIQVGI